MSYTIKNESDDEPQKWLTVAEAARYLRVSRQTIYNYMDSGLLPFYEFKSGGGRRLRRADLDALLERRGDKPASDEGPSSVD